MIRIGKSTKERAEAAEMAAAIAAYTGPIQHCRPGHARGHEKLEPLKTLAPNRNNRAAPQPRAAPLAPPGS
jgi:hypothetical protein